MSRLQEFMAVMALALACSAVSGLAVLGFGYAFYINGGIF